MADSDKAAFEHNLARVDKLGSFSQEASDASDILRCQIVLAMAALDKLLHALLFELYYNRFTSMEEANKGYYEFLRTLKIDFLFHRRPDTEQQFKSYLQSKLKEISLQNPYKIWESYSKVVASKTLDEFWKSLATFTEWQPMEITNRLALYSERRNKIAHEMDSAIESDANQLNPIEAADVLELIETVREIGLGFIQFTQNEIDASKL
jgi:RiboL-PSP-HEPN